MPASSFSARLAMVAWVVAAAFMLRATAQAGLDWPQKTVEVKATADTPVVEVKFPFKNNGRTPVDVTQVESSCGCTTVALEKRHYAPGESGEIVARYTVSDHSGSQKKNVLVSTSDGGEPVELTLAVRIPEILRITPAFVSWDHDEATKPKTITLEVAPDATLKEITVQSSSALMSAELETVTKGRKYRINVHPGKTDQNVFSTLTIRCQFGDAERVFRAYGTVKPPAPVE